MKKTAWVDEGGMVVACDILLLDSIIMLLTRTCKTKNCVFSGRQRLVLFLPWCSLLKQYDDFLPHRIHYLPISLYLCIHWNIYIHNIVYLLYFSLNHNNNQTILYVCIRKGQEEMPLKVNHPCCIPRLSPFYWPFSPTKLFLLRFWFLRYSLLPCFRGVAVLLTLSRITSHRRTTKQSK